MIQQDAHIFQGMSQDSAMSRQDGKLLWDALNIRLTSRGDNTLMSITNERGNEVIMFLAPNSLYPTSTPLPSPRADINGPISADKVVTPIVIPSSKVDLVKVNTIKGSYVGHCIINNHLVVFTVEKDNDMSHIYDIIKNYVDYDETDDTDSPYVLKELYSGNLGFDTKHPIETLASYETETILKVYWVDGINQPRFINIVLKEYLPSDDGGDTQFDFVPTLQLNEKISVERFFGEGVFSPGVIQYAFTYYNLHGQESKIFYTTPLQYIANVDRGGNPEKTIACFFKITVSNVDKHFDYLRVYSIHRVNYQAQPLVKRVQDIEIDKNSDTITVTDTGTIGDTVELAQLLYIGGRLISANTIAEKDNTLFLGDITLKNEYKAIKEALESIEWDTEDAQENLTEYSNPITEGLYYSYDPVSILNYKGGFKTHESYRLGVQAQLNTGEWLSPVHIRDEVISDTYPLKTRTLVQWHTKNIIASIPDSTKEALRDLGVVKLRPCVVFPEIYERDVLYQGVVCPTLYQLKSRSKNAPYAQASWFFRPAVKDVTKNNEKSSLGSDIEYRHNKYVITGPYMGAELPDDNYNFEFKVDHSILTFHSPDIEFDDQFLNMDYTDYNLNLIGISVLSSISGNIMMEASAGTSPSSYIKTNDLGYSIGTNFGEDKHPNNGGLVSSLSFKDLSKTLNADVLVDQSDVLVDYLIYPWQRRGLLNDTTSKDSTNEFLSDTRTGIFRTKTIANLKFFGYNNMLKSAIQWDIRIPKPFYSDLVTVLSVDSPEELKADKKTYYGNINTEVYPSNQYRIYGAQNNGVIDIIKNKTTNTVATTKDLISITYKSTPHIVISTVASKEEDDIIYKTLPVIKEFNDEDTTENPDSQNTQESLEINISLIEVGTALTENPRDYNLGDYALSLSGTKGFYLYQVTEGKGATPEIYRWVKQQSGLVQNIQSMTFKLNTPIIKVTEDDRNMIEEQLIVRQKIDFDNPVPFAMIDPNSDGFYSLSGTSNTYASYYIVEESYTTEEVDDRPHTYFRFFLKYKGLQNQQLNNELVSLRTVKKELFVDKGSFDLEYGSMQRNSPYMWITELVRKNLAEHRKLKFGGIREDAIKQNLWYPAGEPQSLDSEISMPLIYGDTWYSRYDCLKTYPFSLEDLNLIIEIGSFLLETRLNIDGRYDTLRGLTNNLLVHPQLNYNKMNLSYTSKGVFTYRIPDKITSETLRFSNQFTWTLVKEPSAYTDSWTEISLGTLHNVDGKKGKITKIVPLKDLLICFQEHSISQILFNSRVLIQTSDGVPIEIANNQKLEGTRPLDEHIGCQNKWSVCATPAGIYFIDNYIGSIFIFDGQQCKDMTSSLGMATWTGKQYTDVLWIPENTGDIYNGIRTFYDYENKDVYFVPGMDNSDRKALCFNELLGLFISFMDYQLTPAMFSWQKGFYSIWPQNSNILGDMVLYRNFTGEYNRIYGKYRPFYIQFISNQNPELTKIFDTVEYRGDLWSGGQVALNSDSIFTHIEVDNEYQNTGEQKLTTQRTAILRGEDTSVRNKFRAWRANIPRAEGTRLRIRNPWTRIKLSRQVGENNNVKALLHDIIVKYSI